MVLDNAMSAVDANQFTSQHEDELLHYAPAAAGVDVAQEMDAMPSGPVGQRKQKAGAVHRNRVGFAA